MILTKSQILGFCALAILVVGSLTKSMGWFSLYLWQVEIALGGDKVVHVIVAYLCAFSLLCGFATYNRQKLKFNSLLFALMTAAFSLDEILQLFIASRQFSWKDLASNYLGITLAIISWLLLSHHLQQKTTREQQHGIR